MSTLLEPILGRAASYASRTLQLVWAEEVLAVVQPFT